MLVPPAGRFRRAGRTPGEQIGRLPDGVAGGASRPGGPPRPPRPPAPPRRASGPASALRRPRVGARRAAAASSRATVWLRSPGAGAIAAGSVMRKRPPIVAARSGAEGSAPSARPKAFVMMMSHAVLGTDSSETGTRSLSSWRRAVPIAASDQSTSLPSSTIRDAVHGAAAAVSSTNRCTSPTRPVALCECGITRRNGRSSCRRRPTGLDRGISSRYRSPVRPPSLLPWRSSASSLEPSASAASGSADAGSCRQRNSAGNMR